MEEAGTQGRGGSVVTRKNPSKNVRGEMEKGRQLGGRNRKRRRESISMVDTDRGQRGVIKGAEKGVGDARGLHKTCRERYSLCGVS